jgi:hypothetical protein
MFKKNDICLGVPSCAESFGNSPRGAIIAFQDRIHSFNGAESRSVWRNGRQLYSQIVSAKSGTQGEW